MIEDRKIFHDSSTVFRIVVGIGDPRGDTQMYAVSLMSLPLSSGTLFRPDQSVSFDNDRRLGDENMPVNHYKLI